ncbi:MAG: amidohydrolase family protein [Bacteroidota bacterium]|nr:amidohydrolase family protein [Bacteroidota bacterium]
MKIDSHQHFWIFNEYDYGWMGDNMQVIKKDLLPSDLAIELNKIGFDGSVAVQARQKLEETRWLLRLADQNDFIKGVVGWVDLRSPDIDAQLAEFAAHPKAVGVRHVIHDEPDDDFMLRPNFVAGVKKLINYNLTYDILVFPKHLPNTVAFVEQFSENQIFVIDHIAKPLIKDKILSPWKEDMERLAKFPNVYVKLSGMVTEADWDNWKPTDFKPYLDTVIGAFGTNRVMIGSDWPVCRVAGEYPQIMGIVMDYINSLSESEKNKILGGNAIKAYKLKQ